MKTVMLNDGFGRLDHLAFWKMYGVPFGYEKPHDQELMALMARWEQNRYLNTPEGQFEYSRFAIQLNEKFDGEAGQQLVAAYTAMAMVANSRAGDAPSMYTGISVVLSFVKSNPMYFSTVGKDGLSIAERDVPRTRDGIEKAFKRYKSCIHILAANTFHANMRFNRTSFDLHPAQEATIIKTAMEFQSALARNEYMLRYGWEPFDLLINAPKELANFETGFHSNMWADELRSTWLKERAKKQKKF